MQDNNKNDFQTRMEILLLKMLVVNEVINHSTYKKVRKQYERKELRSVSYTHLTLPTN